MVRFSRIAEGALVAENTKVKKAVAVSTFQNQSGIAQVALPIAGMPNLGVADASLDA